MRTLKSILFISGFILLAATSTTASTFIMGTMEAKSDAKKLSEKYSLKNLGSLTHKTATFYTLKSSLEFKGIAGSSNNSNANYLKYNKGNISYVIPYRYKVVLPRFKTPSPVQP